MTDYHIKVESSATPHCGILHFTYPSSDQSRIQIDLARRVGGTSTSQYIKVVDDYTIQGWMKCTPSLFAPDEHALADSYQLHRQQYAHSETHLLNQTAHPL